MAKRTRANAGINKLLKRDKKDFIAVGLLIVICLTAFNVIFSDMYIYNGATNSPASFCQSCTSSQFTYGSNWGTWYVNPNAVFPIQLKVNDMYNENAITDVYSKYRVNLVDNSTGGLIKDFSGNFETAGYMESNTIYYNYTVAKESTVVARVYLSRDGGLSWEESYYYQTGTSPSWTFKYQPTTVSDIDKDGIPDDTDMCKYQPETYNGYLDNDGCPDTVPSTYAPSSTGDSGSTSPPPITPVTPTTPATTTNGTTTTTTTTNTSATDPFNTVKYDESKNIPISMGTPCDEWAYNKVKFLAVVSPDIASLFQGILLPFCWAYKIIAYGASLPIIILLNIVNTFNYICASSFGFGFGYLLPFVLTIIFLLLLLVPDDIISFGIGVFLMYILGTTAPVAGTMSVLTALGGGFATIGTATNLFVIGGALEIGPKAIFWILFLLAMKETFYSQGALTVPFVSYRKKGDDIIPTEKSMTVRYGSGISQLRHVIAEALFVVLGAMWVECHWGIPVYTAVLGAIDAIIQGIQIVGGAI